MNAYQAFSLATAFVLFVIGFRIAKADPRYGARRCSFVQHPVIWLFGERRLPGRAPESDADRLRRAASGMSRDAYERHNGIN